MEAFIFFSDKNISSYWMIIHMASQSANNIIPTDL
jgi:hypothetical protein